MKGSMISRSGGDPDQLLNASDHIEGQISHTLQTSMPLNTMRPHAFVTCSYPGCNLIYSGHDPLASSVMIRRATPRRCALRMAEASRSSVIVKTQISAVRRAFARRRSMAPGQSSPGLK